MWTVTVRGQSKGIYLVSLHLKAFDFLPRFMQTMFDLTTALCNTVINVCYLFSRFSSLHFLPKPHFQYLFL